MTDAAFFTVFYLSLIAGPLIMASDRLRSAGLAVLACMTTFWGTMGLSAAQEAGQAVSVIVYILFSGTVISFIWIVIREWRSTRVDPTPPQKQEAPEIATDSR